MLMNKFIVRSLMILIGVVLVTAMRRWWRIDKAESHVEVYEWSIWVGNPAHRRLNASRIYNNAMPTIVGTNRPKVEDKEAPPAFRSRRSPSSSSSARPAATSTSISR